ncbi:MAG: hypothetical protein OXG79_12015 [Chloroflexi bacterium]|nr:hypothetical protein [Chloroflexota bacterium]MCY4110818.1 hypothetical protein [Chloroflexota bacterium]
MRIAVWLLATVLALMFGAAVGLGWKPLTTAKNPVAPSFGLGPLVGSITQSVAFSGGPIDTITLWARSEGGPAADANVHLLRAGDGQPLRSARFEAPPSAELQEVSIAIASVDFPAGPLAIRVVALEDSPAELYVGATGNDAYAAGQLVDQLGRSPIDVDLAFSASGHAGALTRLRVQATESPLYLGVGLAVALLVGTVVGRAAWSSLDRRRFGRPAALALSGGVTAALLIALMHGPDAVT